MIRQAADANLGLAGVNHGMIWVEVAPVGCIEENQVTSTAACTAKRADRRVSYADGAESQCGLAVGLGNAASFVHESASRRRIDCKRVG